MGVTIQIPVAYVVTAIVTLAGVIGVLFKLYLGKEKEVRDLEERLLNEKEKTVNILAELRRLLLQRRGKGVQE